METSELTPRTHFMRPALLLFLCATPAFSQLFSFGVKGGVPLTDFVNAASNDSAAGFVNFATHTDRFLVGPTFELHLPFGFSVEVDALYRHFNYQETTQAANLLSVLNANSNDWEFPILGKYRFPHTKLVRPFIDAGVAFDTLQGLTTSVSNVISSGTTQVSNGFIHGYVVGGGIDIKILVIHIQPEIRYTRWGDGHLFDPSGIIHSSENQGEFLLGVTF
jgi:hypothetical protein